MNRDDVPRDPRIADIFDGVVLTGASATALDELVPAVRARVRRRRAARAVGAGASSLAVVAAVALGAAHLGPAAEPGRAPAGQVTVQGDYPVYTLEELVARADVVFEGTAHSVDESPTAHERLTSPPLLADFPHPLGDEMSVGWYCFNEPRTSPPFLGHPDGQTTFWSGYGLLGVTEDEHAQVWEAASRRLESHCGRAIREARGSNETRSDSPPVLIVGPDLGDLSLSARLDPDLSMDDVFGRELGSRTADLMDPDKSPSLTYIREAFEAAFPGFEVVDDYSICRLEPLAPTTEEDEAAPVVPVRLVSMDVDTMRLGRWTDLTFLTVVQTMGSDWEPPLEEGTRYLIFGERRPDGGINIVGGSAGAFLDDGLGGWLPLLQASVPVRHLTGEQVAAMFTEGDVTWNDGALGDAGPGRPASWRGMIPFWEAPADFYPGVPHPPVLAAWGLEPGVLYVTGFGSSSCPWIHEGRRWDGETLTIVLPSGEGTRTCLADLVPYTSIVRMPEDLDPSVPVPFAIALDSNPECALFEGTLLPENTVREDGSFEVATARWTGGLCS